MGGISTFLLPAICGHKGVVDLAVILESLNLGTRQSGIWGFPSYFFDSCLDMVVG